MKKISIPLMFLIMLLPALGRLILHGFDATFFIVADTQFTDPARTPYPVRVVDGAGYDGQFYFKTALDMSVPTPNGVEYDDVVYRKQRIIYPLLAWLLTFGVARLIPFGLILVNGLSLTFIWLLFYRLCAENDLPPFLSLLPAMYTGLQMSVGRDLVEPVETLLILCLLYFGTSHPLRFFLLASLALLTKETTLIYILPISAVMVFSLFQQKSAPLNYLLIALPYGIQLAWKSFLETQAGTTATTVHGGFNFTYPFAGMVAGFSTYFKEITVKNMISFGLAALALAWIIWLAVMVFPYIKTALRHKFKGHYAEAAWLAWLIFSLFFSFAIYQDDWSFVRLFSSFTGVSFFILYQNRMQPGKWFVLFSLLMFAIITTRLWLRV